MSPRQRNRFNTLLDLNLTDKEAFAVRRVLLSYFPQLGTDEEMNGGDVVDELNNLYSLLPECLEVTVVFEEYISEITRWFNETKTEEEKAMLNQQLGQFMDLIGEDYEQLEDD